MYKKRKIHFINLVFLVFYFTLSCAKKEKVIDQFNIQKPADIKIERPKKEEIKKYVYKGDKYRDFLFSPLEKLAPENESDILNKEKRPANAPIVFNFDSIKLRGLASLGQEKFAFISDDDGNSFVLKEGKIFDIKKRQINNVTGIIKKKSIILLFKNKLRELHINKRFTYEK